MNLDIISNSGWVYLVNEFTPEETRRTELMADAFSAYYMSHAQGAAMQWKRVRQFLRCSLISEIVQLPVGASWHTSQRMAAAEMGFFCG
jgi:hypothetical protein